MELYDNASEIALNNNINEIVDEVSKIRLETLEPTMNERLTVREIILNFIKQKGRKIYGGWAFNELIKVKNPKDAFYKDIDVPDVEFYSSEPLNDLLELCNRLYENKELQGIVGKEAQHTETYTIYVNNEKYCDISYVPKLIYNKIPVIIINGLHMVEPSFLIIDVLRTFSDPLTSYWRLTKTFKRIRLLHKYYPIKSFSKPSTFPPKVNSAVVPILTDIQNFLINRSSMILFDYAAYIIFMNDGKFIKDIPYYECVSTEYVQDCTELYNLLKSKYDVKITEYYPFFQFYGHNAIISYNNIPVIHIYNNNAKCIQYQDIKVSNSNYIRVGSFAFVLLMLYVLFHKARVDNDKDKEYNLHYMIYSLLQKRNSYLKEHKKTIIDNTIFKEFGVTCVGKTIDPPRLFRKKIEKRKEQGKPYVFSYEPSKEKKPNIENWQFANTSGNVINNERNKKLDIK